MINIGDKIKIVRLDGLDKNVLNIGNTYEVVRCENYKNGDYEFDIVLNDGTNYTMCDLDVKSGVVNIINM